MPASPARSRNSGTPGRRDAGTSPEPTTAQVRSWARSAGIDVPDRGRLRPEVWAAYRTAHEKRSGSARSESWVATPTGYWSVRERRLWMQPVAASTAAPRRYRPRGW